MLKKRAMLPLKWVKLAVPQYFMHWGWFITQNGIYEFTVYTYIYLLLLLIEFRIKFQLQILIWTVI